MPGWGAFVSQYVGARLSADGSKLLPPTRVLAFNSDVAHNDGLLASGIARREGISYDAAVALIANEVSIYFHRVDVLGELVMPRIGQFLKSNNGAIVFEPDRDAPIVSTAYIGLPTVGVQVVGVDEPEEEQKELHIPYACVRKSSSIYSRVAWHGYTVEHSGACGRFQYGFCFGCDTKNFSAKVCADFGS